MSHMSAWLMQYSQFKQTARDRNQANNIEKIKPAMPHGIAICLTIASELIGG